MKSTDSYIFLYRIQKCVTFFLVKTNIYWIWSLLSPASWCVASFSNKNLRPKIDWYDISSLQVWKTPWVTRNIWVVKTTYIAYGQITLTKRELFYQSYRWIPTPSNCFFNLYNHTLNKNFLPLLFQVWPILRVLSVVSHSWSVHC